MLLILFKIIPDNRIPTINIQLTNPLLVVLLVKNGKTCENPKLVKTDSNKIPLPPVAFVDKSDAILVDYEHRQMDSHTDVNVLQ